ncbi:MAG: alpha/beta fold hydrolase [Candidatus Cohnella colombiensis]|uniref:Alpha/beta fold hydrolase n=1 Tax=Candidatus Cohnella colombiensis TaxID=3121368 RepID=A0AA95J9U3_9BACL|nr:MAG: alpha/beta fold hydrolase [Cohnella sp.]
MSASFSPLPQKQHELYPSAIDYSVLKHTSPNRRIAQFLLKGFFMFVFTLLALFIAIHAYVAWLLTHPFVTPLQSNPRAAVQLEYSEVTFPSSDEATKVDGWWIPASGSRQSVILSHGFGTNREEPWVPMYELANLLHQQNYNVLMFDYGFASENHRTVATGGLLESQQLRGAIQYVRSLGNDEVFVWGFSMGAGIALQAALQGEPIDAMILDSTFLFNEDTLYYNLQKYLKLPKYPSVSLIRWFLPLIGGTRLDQIPSSQVQETAYSFPILLIHGTADDKAPYTISENIAHAQTNRLSQLWIVDDAIHEMIYRTYPDQYVSHTLSFLNQVHANRFE